MKKNGISKSTLRISICGIATALGTVLMFLTTLVPIGTYAFPCFAGMITVVIVVEYGLKWSFGVYMTTSVLSVILAGDKEAVVFFILFFGYYPILKSIFEQKLKLKPLRIIVKFSVFNFAAVAAFFITTLLLAISPEEYTIMGFYVPWLFLIIGNIFFAIYDFAVTLFVFQYIQRFRGKFFGKL